MRIPITPTNTRLLAMPTSAPPQDATHRRRPWPRSLLQGLYEIALFRVAIFPRPAGDEWPRLVRRVSKI
jgi:hypothetical protein